MQDKLEKLEELTKLGRRREGCSKFGELKEGVPEDLTEDGTLLASETPAGNAIKKMVTFIRKSNSSKMNDIPESTLPECGSKGDGGVMVGHVLTATASSTSSSRGSIMLVR